MTTGGERLAFKKNGALKLCYIGPWVYAIWPSPKSNPKPVSATIYFLHGARGTRLADTGSFDDEREAKAWCRAHASEHTFRRGVSVAKSAAQWTSLDAKAPRKPSKRKPKHRGKKAHRSAR